MTTRRAIGSRFRGVARSALIPIVLSAGCKAGEAAPTAQALAARPIAVERAADPEPTLGVGDKGIWADLDPKVQLHLPDYLTPERVSAQVDNKHQLIVLAVDGFPRKVYPLGGDATLAIGDRTLALRPGDRDELRPLLTADNVRDGAATHDRDGDGIPDPLDVLIGAKKTVINADAYTVGAKEYIEMRYPMGDVPRNIGVCTDVVIRSVRNSGLDLQRELHEDIHRAHAAYPMVRGGGDANIDQRRVGTLLPYFKRHWERHGTKADDPKDPFLPGDVVFMDTFPDRPGPDHIGVVSDELGPSGLPLIINNWTDGTVTTQMDLLVFVPILDRYRLPP